MTFAVDVYGNKHYHPWEDMFITDDEIVVTCDICGKPQWTVGDDWNGETGNHLSCEKNQ